MSARSRRSARANPSTTATHLHGVQVVKGIIQTVDPVRWVASVIPIQGGMPIEDIPINPMSVGADGQGSFYMPEVNTPVWLCRPSDERTPFILAGATLPRQLDDSDDEENPNDHRMNRPVLGEGDQMISGPGASPFIILRKGGSLEIGSTQMAQRIYIPLQDTIREFFNNYEQNAAGGKMSWRVTPDDSFFGSGQDSVEWRLRVKEFADEDPMIDIGLGRISSENDTAAFGGLAGDIVGRILINDAFELWVDKEGNIQRTLDGTVMDSIGGRKIEFIASDFIQVARGVVNQDLGSRSTKIHRGEQLDVGGSTEIRRRGNLTEQIDGVVTRSQGQTTEEYRGLFRSVKGDAHLTATANIKQLASGNMDIGAGQKWDEKVGGKKSVTVTNANYPTGELTGYEVTVVAGSYELHTVTDEVQITAGPFKTAALAKVSIKPTGVIVMESTFGIVSMEMNATGVKLSTIGGSIELGHGGLVKLGPGGPLGAVVTTLTHPVDRVTGTPILGSANVVAGGAPSPVGSPTTGFITGDLL